jgi:hypothetical protein
VRAGMLRSHVDGHRFRAKLSCHSSHLSPQSRRSHESA